jgi:hypothetical protein
METFRVSKRSLLLNKLRPFVPPIMILCLLGYATISSNGHPGVHVPGFVAFSIAITAFTWRVSWNYARWAALHSLTVSDQALLTNDGAKTVRTSYDQIDKLVLRRVRGRLIVARIVYNNKFREGLLQYADCSRLVALLVKKVPASRVSERNWFNA